MYGFCKKFKDNDTFVFSHEVFWKGNEKNFPLIERKTKPRAERYREQKFRKENIKLLKKIENSMISDGMKETLIELLQYKDRMNENKKKIKLLIEKIYL